MNPVHLKLIGAIVCLWVGWFGPYLTHYGFNTLQYWTLFMPISILGGVLIGIWRYELRE